MKTLYKEKHKLPLTFSYIESFTNKNTRLNRQNIIYFIDCKKYHSNFYVREKPVKPLIRML